MKVKKNFSANYILFTVISDIAVTQSALMSFVTAITVNLSTTGGSNLIFFCLCVFVVPENGFWLPPWSHCCLRPVCGWCRTSALGPVSTQRWMERVCSAGAAIALQQRRHASSIQDRWRGWMLGETNVGRLVTDGATPADECFNFSLLLYIFPLL